MADDKNNTGEPDRSRISLSEIYEVKYWSDKYGTTAPRLKAAVAAVGDSPEAVEKWLRQNG
jgi:uncharacterized protein DUF3606